MHVVIEKARKAAGISSLTKNYPDNPKHRGCGFWAAFIGVIGSNLAEMDARYMEAQKQIAELASQNAELEAKMSKIFRKSVANGVEAITLAEGWTHDKQSSVLAKIAG